MNRETGLRRMEGFLVGGGVGFLAEGVEQMLLVLCPLGTPGWQLQLSGQLLDTQGTPHPKSLPLFPPEGFFRPQEHVGLGAGLKCWRIHTSGLSPQPARAGVGR